MPLLEQDYEQPTPTLDQQDISSHGRDQYANKTVRASSTLMGGMMDYQDDYNSLINGITINEVHLANVVSTFPQPTVRMLKPGSKKSFATSVRFEVTFARSVGVSETGYTGVFGPSLPKSLKIVCGFLENSYHRSV